MGRDLGGSESGDQCRSTVSSRRRLTHLLPAIESPRFLSSPLRVTTVSVFQFRWLFNSTAETRVRPLDPALLGEGGQIEAAVVGARAVRRLDESLRRSMVV
jgi:hypothetical protein